ncbi:MAG: hypothetical protein ACFFCL_17090 [Promethearchaeota archaeon]
MAKKENDKTTKKAHDIVFFKTKDDIQAEEIDKYSFETVDQEDKIKLATDYRPFSGHFQYSILIDNQSLAPITEMKIKIKFPEFFKLERCYPHTISIPRVNIENNIKLINLEFNELNEKSTKQLHLHFSPNSIGTKGEIRTIVTYVNNKDTIRVLDSRPTEITIDKISIEPKVVPSSFIREFTQTPGIKKVIKSFGVGIKHQKDSETYFEILVQLFFKQNFQLVAKDVNKRILWYFGTEPYIKEDILAIGQIISNKIEIIASSMNHNLLISFLTLISNNFKERLIINRIIKSKEQVYDLECKNCGAILPSFPQKSRPVICKNCNYEQIIW